MATWLRQSTAVDIALGPFVAATDGVTAETALTIAQSDVRLKKNGGAFAQKNQVSSATHEENGFYEVSLDATDTNTLGILLIGVSEAGALPVWEKFLVVPAVVYDAMIAGTDNLDVNAVQVLGTAIATPAVAGVLKVDLTHVNGTAAPSAAGRPEVNTTHAAGTAWNSGGIGAATLAANTLTAAKVATDVDARLADATWDEARAGHATAGTFGEGAASVQGNVTGQVGSIADNGITAATFVPGAIDALAIAPGALDADAFTSGALGAIEDAVWDSGLSAHTVIGSFGENHATLLAGLVAVNADTDNIQTRLPASLVSGRIDASVGAMAANTLTATALDTTAGDEIADKVWDEPRAGHVTAGTFGAGVIVDSFVTGAISAASIAAAAANKMADHFWRRTYANTRGSGDGDAVSFRSGLGAIAKLVNKWSISGSTLTVTHEDDTTTAGTQTLTGTAGADPITAADTV